jgi:lycopene cyclase domain-containing protein
VGEEMTYPELTLVVLGIFAVYTLLMRKFLQPKPLLLAALIMLKLTLIFDNVIIGTGIVAYDQSKLSGIMLGYAPIEDFAYTLVALVLIPSLFEVFKKK